MLAINYYTKVNIYYTYYTKCKAKTTFSTLLE